MASNENITSRADLTQRRPQYDKDELKRRGEELYERIRPRIEPDNHGEIVAIDVETGSFEIAGNPLRASEKLLARCPNAQIWFVRIGHRDLFRIGPRIVLAST